MPWLIVLGDADAIEWVTKRQRMAFRDEARIPHFEKGERVAIYQTRGAYHNPGKDEARIVALGSFASAIRAGTQTVAGHDYGRWCKLKISAVTPPRRGLPFRPLVAEMDFIRSKSGWSTSVRRTLVRISDLDFRTIEEAFVAHVAALTNSASLSKE